MWNHAARFTTPKILKEEESGCFTDKEEWSHPVGGSVVTVVFKYGEPGNTGLWYSQLSPSLHYESGVIITAVHKLLQATKQNKENTTLQI